MCSGTGMACGGNVRKLHQVCVVDLLDATHCDNNLKMKNTRAEHYFPASRASFNMKAVVLDMP